jgi:hypothetical protein
MRKYFTLGILALTCFPLFGQEEITLSKHILSVDFGSYRNRYLYPITNINYSAPEIEKINIRFSARLRSYGTLFFYSKSAYDFTPIAEYFFTDRSKPVYLSAGLGIDARIRMVNDERSEAEHSAEPLISLAAHGNYTKFSFNTPLWTRFYSNGISFTILPQAAWKAGEQLSVFLRYELSYLSIYKVLSHEWRRDCFIGLGMVF